MTTPRRWYFVCRHEHEAPLLDELTQLGALDAAVVVSGLCVADVSGCEGGLDPTWALNVLPDGVVVPGDTLRALAAAVADQLAGPLDAADGPWALVVVVPGVFRGNPTPPMARRAGLLQSELLAVLKKIRGRALRRRVDVSPTAGAPLPPYDALAQLVLLEPGRVLVSWARVHRSPTGACWPNAYPAGHAPLPDDPAAPASSYRKLEEAFALLGRWPVAGERAMDLGASPGGWTRVLRRYGAHVVAVDRSPLAPALMADVGVDFVAGDAFATDAPGELDWLVSDIVAFPERIVGLLGELRRFDARFCVVQMKFRGDVDWAAIAAGHAAAHGQGYDVRCKHLFNDKNEVTFVARRRDQEVR